MESDGRQVRRLSSIAFSLYLAAAGTSLIGFSTIIAAYGMRQAVRAEPLPLHPWGTVAGLIAFPVGALCVHAAQRRLADLDDDLYRAWRLRELS
ncbi:MAG: hypothetical protein AB7N70_38995 [Dehalococcoidia bacterium]